MMSGCDLGSSTPGRSRVEQSAEEDQIRILVASDIHIGHAEKVMRRDMDSIRTFEEILEIATNEKVDFVLLGGDLFHENNPSREMQYRVIRLLRRYCLNDRPVALRFLSDPSVNFTHSLFSTVNYEDSNINVGLPIFTIHGNHDDLSGKVSFSFYKRTILQKDSLLNLIRFLKGLTALDTLHESGLLNFFGKFEEIENFVVSPVLLKKGRTNLALYGIGNQRDDRLCRAFRDEDICFLRPKEDAESWFNLLVLHQNRPVRSRDRSTGGHLPESYIPSFFDLVIWGHEHECKIEPQYYERGLVKTDDGFYLIQPGSTVVTTLSPEEARAKHVAVVTISGRSFNSKAVRLETVRQFLFADLEIRFNPPVNATKNHRPKDMPDEEIIREKIDEMLEDAEKTKLVKQPQPPLFRIRVTYQESWITVMKLNCRQFGLAYADKVVNPTDMVTVRFEKKSDQGKFSKGLNYRSNVERAITIEEIVNKRLAARGREALLVFPQTTLNSFLMSQVRCEGGRYSRNDARLEKVKLERKKLIDGLQKMPYEQFSAAVRMPNEKYVMEFEDKIYEDIRKVRDSQLAAMKNEV